MKALLFDMNGLIFDSEREFQAKDGVKELLGYAKQKGYKLALVTSSKRDDATRRLEHAGLYRYFDNCFVFGDMVKHKKPHPEIYEKACDLLRLTPEECVAFEDEAAGVESAAAAGMDVIMVSPLEYVDVESSERAWKILDSLEDVIAFMRSEAAAAAGED